MITRDDLRELSQFRFRDSEQCALSFYFQPSTPRNKSHREEAILAKDLVRNALRQLNANGNDHCARVDLERLLSVAEQLHGNRARAKAIFSYGREKFWREFDLPPELPETQLFVNRRFHLKPLAALLEAQPRLGVALVDRQKARLFDLGLDGLREHLDLFHPVSRRGKSDGFAGYDGGHAERRVSDDVLHHFRNVASVLKEQAENRLWEKLVIGCQETNWYDFEAQLHSLVRQRVLGHFSAEVATISDEQVRERALQVFRRSLDDTRHRVVKDILSYAKSHGRGVTGLRRVLRALQMGEVQTLVMGQNYHARAVECPSCGYLDAHIVAFCPGCGRPTLKLDDVCDAMIPLAIRREIEVFHVNDPELDRAGNIGALLRFRAERGQPMAAAS